jgi:hypothetical protein
VELSGHQSELLRNAIKEGKLLGFELWDDRVESGGFDERDIVKKQRRELKLSVSPQLSSARYKQAIERVKAWAAKNKYTDMRVRWRDPSVSKPQAVTFPTAKQDAGEALFVKQVEVSVKNPLPQGCDKIRNDLVQRIKEVT